jgi:hypothetical protein
MKKVLMLALLMAVSSQAGVFRVIRHSVVHPVHSVKRLGHGTVKVVKFLVW